MTDAMVAAARRWFDARSAAVALPTADARKSDDAKKAWSDLAEAEAALSAAVARSSQRDGSERVIAAVVELTAALQSIGIDYLVFDIGTPENGDKLEVAFRQMVEDFYRGRRHRTMIAGVPVVWPYDSERIPF